MLSTVRSHLQGLYEFHLLNPVLVGLFWLGALVVALLGMPQTLQGFLVPLLLVGLASVLTVYRLTRALAERGEKPGQAPWIVEVNGVQVGDVSDERMAAIQHTVAVDTALYLLQLGNLVRGLITAATSLVNLIPLMCFWLGVALVAFEPEAARALLTNLAAASPDELRSALLHFAKLFGLVGVTAIGVVVALSTHKGNSLGFRNQFTAAFGERLRHEVECAADGEVRWFQRGHLLYAQASTQES